MASVDGAGTLTLRADAAAVVRMFRSLLVQAARHLRRGTPVRLAAAGPLPYWGGSGVRVSVGADGGDGRESPAGTDFDDDAWFMPFPLRAGGPGNWGLELLDAFLTAIRHEGDVFARQASPVSAAFEVWLPLDPATVVRPPISAGRLHVQGGGPRQVDHRSRAGPAPVPK